MTECSVEKLRRLLDKQLSLNERLRVFDHLDHCGNCKDAVYQMSRRRCHVMSVQPHAARGAAS